MACNPAKTARWLAKKAAREAAEVEQAAAAVTAGTAVPLEEPSWEALEEAQAVVVAPSSSSGAAAGEAAASNNEGADMEVDEEGGEDEEMDLDDWQMVPEDDVELLAGAFADLHN